MAFEVAIKRAESTALGVEYQVEHRTDDETLKQFSSAFRLLLEFVRERKVNHVAPPTSTQTVKEVKSR